MNIKEFGECLEFNIEHNIKHAILGLGAPGVGKSQIIRQIGEKYGYKVIDIRLAQMSEVEIGGLIYPNADRTKTCWLAPETLPDEKRDGKNTILLLDELTSCTKRVQVAAYQLILDRRIGQYTLPEGCFVVALGNREDDDGVYIQLSGPLADRFEIHFIDVDFDSWLNDYALKYNVHPLVVEYLKFKPAALHNQTPGDGNIVFSTPRSWDRVSDYLKYDIDVSKPVVRHKIIGNVGEKEGLQFIEFCRNLLSHDYVTAEDYLSRRKPAPQKLELLSILAYSLTDSVSFLTGVAAPDDLTPGQRRQLERVIDGLVRLPMAEFSMRGLKELLDMNRTVTTTVFLELDSQALLKFISDNAYALGLESGDTGKGRITPWQSR